MDERERWIKENPQLHEWMQEEGGEDVCEMILFKITGPKQAAASQAAIGYGPRSWSDIIAKTSDPVEQLGYLAGLIAPEFVNRPPYCIRRSDVRGLIDANDGVSFHGPMLDALFRPYLESIGVYHGRGPVIVLDCCDSEIIPIGLHELAHAIEYMPDSYDETPVAASIINLAPEQPTAVISVAVPAFGSVRGQSHGLRFTRAALHLHHRAVCAGVPINLHSMNIAGPMHGMADPAYYQAALASELRIVSLQRPLRELYTFDMPPEFVALHDRDTAAWAS